MRISVISLFFLTHVLMLSAQEVDSIIDIRDRLQYKVVKIGRQWWMQENLNIGIRIDGTQEATDDGDVEKYCYDNNEAYCDTFGGLYRWNEMMDYNFSDDGNPGTTQGVCPLGWHLPTDIEWSELADYLGGESLAGGMLKDTGTIHWINPNTGATNTSGFTALPGGYMTNEGNFAGIGMGANFWSSTENISSYAWARVMFYNGSGISRSDYIGSRGYSVRCIRDSCHFSYLTVSDAKLNTFSKLDFTSEKTIDTIIITNTSAGQTVNISSIQTTTSAYSLSRSSAVISTGDTVHFHIDFNPPRKDGTHYLDTICIESDDPYRPVITVPLNGYIKTDEIIDIRDGQVYKIVKIGRQWWMQENLNTGVPISGSLDAGDNGIIEKYCYENNELYCDTFGGLYQWDEAMDYHPSDTGNPGTTRGICPAGWHLPSDYEWLELRNFLGGMEVAGGKLKQTGNLHWNSPNTGATNESGFSAIPAGYRDKDGYFDMLGIQTYFWTSTEYKPDDIQAWSPKLDYDDASAGLYHYSKKDGVSLRCVRDSVLFSKLTVTDKDLKMLSDLNFVGYNSLNEIILINSDTGKAIDISSMYIKNTAFGLDKTNAGLPPGDSIHLIVTFNPPDKDIYRDTLFIESNDPYDSLITIPLNGTFPPEISFTDSVNISCFGYSDGTATVTPSLGTPPYKYLWNDPAGTADSTATGLAADVYYRVTVTDSVDWTVTDSILLSQPGPLKINPDYSSTVCLYAGNGYIHTDPSGGTFPYNYTWSTGAVTQGIDNLEAGEYYVKVTDSHGCVDSTGITIQSAVPYPDARICIVSIDMLTGDNLIVWERTPGKGIASYKIYREGNHIGTKAYNELSIFRDSVADPEARPYLYYISVVDTCGNESGLSRYHKPHFLQYVGSAGGVNLSWDAYLIEGDTVDFDGYTLYRGSDSTALTPIVENIPIQVTVYTDNDPLALERRYYYRVAGELNTPCYPSGEEKAGTQPFHHALSNLDDNKFQTFIQSPILDEGLVIYPNPVNSRVTIEFDNPLNEKYRLFVINLSGNTICHREDITTGRIDLSPGELPPGLYLIELKGPKIFRGKIVIE